MFVPSLSGLRRGVRPDQGRGAENNASSQPCSYTNYLFAKTGSGQTREKLLIRIRLHEQKRRFLCALQVRAFFNTKQTLIYIWREQA